MDYENHLFGLYRAVVHDNRDPKNLRRLKVKSTATGEQITNWIWPVISTVKEPAIGQGVWVMYLGGDPEYPVWIAEFGKNNSSNKRIFVKPLENSISLIGLEDYLVINDQPDGTAELDLTATLVAMWVALKDHEDRITTLEEKVAVLEDDVDALETGKADVGHSH
jgi:hypothetical protein